MWRAEGREEEGEQAATLVADIPPLRGLHDAWAAGGALGGDRGGLPQLTHAVSLFVRPAEVSPKESRRGPRGGNSTMLFPVTSLPQRLRISSIQVMGSASDMQSKS